MIRERLGSSLVSGVLRRSMSDSSQVIAKMIEMAKDNRIHRSAE